MDNDWMVSINIPLKILTAIYNDYRITIASWGFVCVLNLRLFWG